MPCVVRLELNCYLGKLRDLHCCPVLPSARSIITFPTSATINRQLFQGSLNPGAVHTKQLINTSNTGLQTSRAVA
jgi:hypothetical protein